MKKRIVYLIVALFGLSLVASPNNSNKQAGRLPCPKKAALVAPAAHTEKKQDLTSAWPITHFFSSAI